MELSNNDQRLLASLKRNARLSVSELARELDLSRTTVQKRLARLEQSGVIEGYSVRTSDRYRQGSLQAYVNLVVEPRFGGKVAAELETMPQVEALYTVSGKIDLVAIVRVQSPSQLDASLDRIGQIGGVRGTNSAIVLSTRFDRR